MEAIGNPFGADGGGGPARDGAGPGAGPDQASDQTSDQTPRPEPVARVAAWLDGRERETPVYRREALGAGAALDGPAIVLESTATTVVEPGWRAALAASGDLVLERAVPPPARIGGRHRLRPGHAGGLQQPLHVDRRADGLTLENTALSVNIKERLDFSCALFDPDGMLVANAPHIPIHLGSMSESVRTVARENGGE